MSQVSPEQNRFSVTHALGVESVPPIDDYVDCIPHWRQTRLLGREFPVRAEVQEKSISRPDVVLSEHVIIDANEIARQFVNEGKTADGEYWTRIATLQRLKAINLRTDASAIGLKLDVRSGQLKVG